MFPIADEHFAPKEEGHELITVVGKTAVTIDVCSSSHDCVVIAPPDYHITNYNRIIGRFREQEKERNRNSPWSILRETINNWIFNPPATHSESRVTDEEPSEALELTGVDELERSGLTRRRRVEEQG